MTCNSSLMETPSLIPQTKAVRLNCQSEDNSEISSNMLTVWRVEANLTCIETSMKYYPQGVCK